MEGWKKGKHGREAVHVISQSRRTSPFISHHRTVDLIQSETTMQEAWNVCRIQPRKIRNMRSASTLRDWAMPDHVGISRACFMTKVARRGRFSLH